jgi:RNA polymerase sigma-70 factor (ECF subfamily)
MDAADEQQLILQVKQGHDGAFRLLVERHMKQAYNVAYGFVSDHDDAQDVAQEAFVRVYQSIGTFRGDAVFSTWLYKIVMNLSLNRIRQRKSKAHREVELTDRMIDATPDRQAPAEEQQEMRLRLERALHELPTLQRATVILRHINGLSTKQVSGILAVSEGTVKTHLFRGLKRMRAVLDGEEIGQS